MYLEVTPTLPPEDSAAEDRVVKEDQVQIEIGSETYSTNSLLKENRRSLSKTLKKPLIIKSEAFLFLIFNPIGETSWLCAG